MKTYWDYSEQERAGMAREDVEKLLDFELMEKGVLKVVAPTLEAGETAAEGMPKIKRYGIKYKDRRYMSERMLSVTFGTAADAETFMRMDPCYTESDYDTDGEFAGSLSAASIVVVEQMSEQDYLNSRAALQSAKAVKERNRKARADFEKASQEVLKAGEGVWDDWHECQCKARRFQRIADVRADYVKLADGNCGVAEGFLKMAFPANEIEEAAEWFGGAV